MKIIRALFITALLATIATAEENKPLRVLLTYGGHGFQQKEFFAFWDALPGVTYTKCELPKQADMLKPGLEKEYDAIVTYDMVKGFTPEQQKAGNIVFGTGQTPSAKIDGKWIHRQFLRVEEGLYVNGSFKVERILNGDQTDYGLTFSSAPEVLHVSLSTY